MVALGEERAAEIFKHLSQPEVEALSLEIAKAPKVPSNVCHDVVDEAVETVLAEDYLAEGGVDYARAVLERSLGGDKAEEIICRLAATIERRPFEFLRRTPPEQIHVFLRNESPQTIALVVANLHTALAAQVLSLLPPEDQAEVAMRIALMGETRPEVVAQIESVMKQKLSNVIAAGVLRRPAASSRSPTSSTTPTARPSATCSTSSRRTTASSPRRSACCCSPSRTSSSSTTARSRWCSRRSTRRTSRSPCAASSEDVRHRIFANMSERGAELLREEIEFQPPQRRRVVEEAQGRIVGVVRRLEEAGAIVISRGPAAATTS